MEKIAEQSSSQSDENPQSGGEGVPERQRKVGLPGKTVTMSTGEQEDQLVGDVTTSRDDGLREKLVPRKKKWSDLLRGVFTNNEDHELTFSDTVVSFSRKRFASVDAFEELSLATKKRVQVDQHLRKFGIVCKDPYQTAAPSEGSSFRSNKTILNLDPPFFQVIQSSGEHVLVSWEDRPIEQQIKLVKSGLSSNAKASKVKFDPKVEITLKRYKLYVTGTNFGPIEQMDDSVTVPVEDEISFTQLFWSLAPEEKSKWINCTLPGLKYKFNLTAVYESLIDGKTNTVEVPSVSKFFITIGPPTQPDIRISDLDPLQVTLTWSFVETNPLVEIKGYRISIDDDKRVLDFGPDVRFPVISDLEPMSMHAVRMKVLSCHSSGDSHFSNTVSVRVPPRPQAPTINLLPVEDVGKITISWRIPPAEKTIERVRWCSIYVAEDDNDPGLHEKLSVEQENMSFTFHDLNLSHSYRCFVRAHAGTNEISRSGYFGVCEVFSENSNEVCFTPSAPPVPGNLSVDCFWEDRFVVQWTDPKTFGDAKIKGFHIMRDTEVYGPMIGPNERQVVIEGAVPGSLYRLQLVALSDHPVCKKALVIGGYASAQYFIQAVEATKSGSSQQARLRKIAQRDSDGPKEDKLVPGYEGCLPGPSLMVPFRGLVPRAVNLSVHDIKGSSAVIKWDLGNPVEFQQKYHHHRPPTHYVVYWRIEGSPTANEQETEASEMKLNYLQPKAKYIVIVESRRMQTLDDEKISVKSRSEKVHFSTGSPPSRPVGFRVVDTGQNYVKVAWKKPHVSGFELLGYRLEVSETLDGEKEFKGCRTYCYNIRMSATHFTVTPLDHTTKWKITLMVISNRFFEASRHLLIKENEPIPLGLRFRDIYNHWLPFVSLATCTKSCSEPNVLVPSQVKPNSLLLKWTSSVDEEGNVEGVLGRRKSIKKQVIWYSEFSEYGGGPSSRYFDSVTLSGETRAHVLTNLEPSVIYQINLEAVMVEQEDSDDPEGSNDDFLEVYEPLTLRTPAPVITPTVMITGFTPESISLAWARPSTHRSPEHVFSTRIVHRDLKEYRVVINGKNYKPVNRDQQKAILTKCKPGKTYHFVLATVTSTHHSFKSPDLTEKFSSIEDMSYSAPMSITLPNPQQNGSLKSVRCEFTNNKTDGPNELGYVKVVWSVHKEYATMSNFDSGIESFEIIWECSSQPDEIYSVSASASESWILLPVQEVGSIMKIHLIAFYTKQSRPSEKSGTLIIETPTPPSKPSLLVHHVSQYFFIVEWTFEGGQGINQAAGYKVFINGKKAGNILAPQFFKAKIASRVNKAYEIQLQVISSDSRIEDSELSDVLVVHTDWATIDFYQQMYLDTHGLADDYDLANYLSGRGAYYNELNDQCGEIKLTLVDISEDEIVFRVVDFDKDLIKTVKVEWSSVNSNEIRQAVFTPEQSLVSLTTFGHGVNHFIKFFGLDENGIVAAKSLQISALSAKKLEPPKLRAKNIDFTELVITWLDKPGLKDMIIGHRIFINNKQVAELDNTVKSYTFTKGHMCREYKFEVQALANRESLDSTLSQPLVILWPGIITPEIDQVMTTTGNAIKIAWNSPFASKNVQILGYWVHCVLLEEDVKDDSLSAVEKKIAVGPLPSDITSYQFDNLAYLCQYMIFLQLKIAGVEEFLTSNKLILRPMRFPHAPTIKAHIVGLAERRQLESDLVYELRTWNEMMTSSFSEQPLGGHDYKQTTFGVTYQHMEQILAKIAQYTGKIEGELSWERLPGSAESDLSGYKVLVNDTQIGNELPRTQYKFNFKFSMGKPQYTLCVGSVVQQAAFPLQKSNSITIESSLFMPFSVFCYFKIHNPAAKWPSVGCCSVSDMLKEEFTDTVAKAKRIKNSLPERTNRPNPSVQVFNLFDKTYMALPGNVTSSNSTDGKKSASGQRNDLVVVLFYTYWCLSSQRLFKFLMNWASISSVKVQVVTCCIDSRDRVDTHFSTLASFIRGVKFCFGDNIKHTTGCYAKSSNPKKPIEPVPVSPDDDNDQPASPPPKTISKLFSSTEVQDAYQLIGVPTISIISASENTILWQGRPIVASSEQFSAFISDVIGSL